MRELLEELKKIDPACYDEIWQWVLRLEEDSYAKDDPKYLKHRDDVIQGCVQRAIAARGLYQTIETRSIEPYLWRALVMRADGRTFDHEAVDTSPAKAILASYIASLKAQP